MDTVTVKIRTLLPALAKESLTNWARMRLMNAVMGKNIPKSVTIRPENALFGVMAIKRRKGR